MQKGKSLGPYGLTIQFLLGFYDLIKEDLLLVVRESQRLGKMLGVMNSTFLTLILNKQDGVSFDNYRHISCCNVIYKIAIKILAQRIKPILCEVITEERFGFLQQRQIHYAVSIAQEALHFIKLSKYPLTVLKLDLSKYYE
jgi:hypothetical protein